MFGIPTDREIARVTADGAFDSRQVAKFQVRVAVMNPFIARGISVSELIG